MIVVTVRYAQRVEVLTGTAVEAGIFPHEAGANPSPALLVKDQAGETVATFRTAEVAWFANDAAVTVA